MAGDIRMKASRGTYSHDRIDGLTRKNEQNVAEITMGSDQTEYFLKILNTPDPTDTDNL